MSRIFLVNGIQYTFPEEGDENWGDDVTNWAEAITQGTLQKAGGLFTLTSETDFGPSFGLKSLYFKSRGSFPASGGVIRLSNTELISWRNAGNTVDLPIRVNASNWLQFNSIDLVDISTAQLLTNKTHGTNLLPNANGTLDIGATGTRWKDGWFSGNLTVAGSLSASSVTFTDLTATGNTIIGDANTDTLAINADLITGLRPDVTATYDIGTNALRFKDIYLSGAVTSATLATSGDATIGGNLTVTGDISLDDLTATGNTIIGNANTDTLNIVADLISNIRPDATNTYDLGTSSNRWRDIYVSRDGYISRVIADIGTAGAPSITFISDIDTGLYNSGTNEIGFVSNATLVGQWNASSGLLMSTVIRGQDGSAALPAYTFVSDPDTGIYRLSSDQLNFATGGTERMKLLSTGALQVNNVGSANQHVLFGRVEIQSQDTSGIAGINVLNSATGVSAHSPILLAVQDTASGDPFIRFRIPTAAEYSIGIDNSDADRFKISNSTNVGTNDRLIIDSVGSILVGSGTNVNVGYGFFGEEDTGMYLQGTNELAFSSGNQQTLRISISEIKPQLPIRALNGTSVSPSYSFVNDSDTGMYWSNTPSERLGFSLGGNPVMHFQSGNAVFQYGVIAPDGAVGSPSYAFLSYSTTGIHAAANTLGLQVNGVAIMNVHNDSVRILRPMTAEDGSQTAPSYSFENQDNTGFYRPSADQIGITLAGAFRGRFRTDGLEYTVFLAGDGSVSLPSHSFGNDPDTGMYLEGDGTLSLGKNGARKIGIDPTCIFLDVQTRSLDGTAANPSYSWDNDPDTGIYRGGGGIITFATDANDAGRVDSTRKWTFGQTGDSVHHRFNGGIELASSGTEGFLQDANKSAVINDNQAAPATIFTIVATFRAIIVDYSITRGSNFETGTIHLVCDGTNVQIAPRNVQIGDPAVTFSATVSAGNILLQYTTAATGSAGTMKYSTKRWS